MHLIIDTDTAGDDVVSLLLALHTPWVSIVGITINCGNVAFDYQVANALKTIEVAGKAGQVPVYPGARNPLLRPWVNAAYVHGEDGMGEAWYPPVSQTPESEHAVAFLLEASRRYAGDLVIVAQAPLTNLALAVRQDPEFAHRVSHLWVMGGSANAVGNIEPLSEYNFYVDPEAAAIVFQAHFNMTMVGWDVCLESSVLNDADLAEIERLDTPLSRFFLQTQRKTREFNRTQGILGTTHPDSLTMAMALDPTILTKSAPYFVTIETQGLHTRGTSVVDRLGDLGHEPNARVSLQANGTRFKRILMDMLATGSTPIAPPSGGIR
ncbi:nucleoside hydrolase [Sulfobacillus harzensis]|uniref:Nucleoside hydrolase n=1 Tax=Sulfobacillus harzensis TaxID=2729629 RepID=A0A7Y0L3T4_9FIRM|nr:nucleoside hydrolase [Sulfobacillus harzensis]NMP22776.1 nucleoside hydrolase [Sulfobacillus harzensis]